MSKRARGELLSLVSHDLRAPLGVILGATGEMLNGRVGALDDDQRGQLQLVRRSAEKIARVAADVALAHEIEDGALAIERRSVDARELVRNALDRVERAGELARIDVTRELPQTPALVQIDETRGFQALLNLFSGAAKSARSRVKIAVVATDADHVRVEIERDGAPLAAEIAQALVGAPAGSVADAPLSRVMGLGLWAAETIARAHGRGLEVATRDGLTVIVWSIGPRVVDVTPT